MIDLAHLTNEQRDFIESLGVYFEHYGVSRLVGRLMALLMLADRPLTLEIHVPGESAVSSISLDL